MTYNTTKNLPAAIFYLTLSKFFKISSLCLSMCVVFIIRIKLICQKLKLHRQKFCQKFEAICHDMKINILII